MFEILCQAHLVSSGTIEVTIRLETEPSITIVSYMNILCLLQVCVFVRGTQNLPYNVSKQDQNDIFPKHMGLYKTEYNFEAIFR